MAITSEPVFGLAVMQVLYKNGGEATVRTLIRGVPEFVNLTEDDRAPSLTRENEEVWEQRVRNLKSHDQTEGNVIFNGFVEHVRRGVYRLTDAGIRHLKNKGLI